MSPRSRCRSKRGAINGGRAGRKKGLGATPDGGSSGRHIVDQQQPRPTNESNGAERPPGKLETSGARSLHLTAQAMPDQQLPMADAEPACDPDRKQLCSRIRTAESAQRMRGNPRNRIERASPGSRRHRGRQATGQRVREVVTASMFERQEGASQNAVVFPPDDRCLLRWWTADTFETRHVWLVDRAATARTRGAGVRKHHRPAGATQSPIVARKGKTAVWTHAGKQRLGDGGQHAPHVHGGYGSRG